MFAPVEIVWHFLHAQKLFGIESKFTLKILAWDKFWAWDLIFNNKFLTAIFCIFIAPKKSDIPWLLANDEPGRKLVDGKFENFEFYSWTDMSNGRIAVGGRNQEKF